MAVTIPGEYDFSVFINCPFDRQYLRFLHAVVFTVQDCGFLARCALEINDASEVRVSKIFKIISQCRIGIHDLSRVQLDPRYSLPRFNMPLELGIFLGAKEYGPRRQRQKICLVLDRDPYRYQKFCSDIAGQDVHAHFEKIDALIRVVRDFLSAAQPDSSVIIPGPATIHQRYRAFSRALPTLCRDCKLDQDSLIFNDYVMLVANWLEAKTGP